MNQAVFVAVLVVAVSLGITSGFPMQAPCDKLRHVKEGIDNHDRYLIKLKDSDNYADAKFITDLVSYYQTLLDQHASNVYEPSIRSQLELSENAAGVLHGTLSQQALVLVCLESRVELILPDYTNDDTDLQSSGEPLDVQAADCSKLELDEPYNGDNYHVILKDKASLNDLYKIITKIELAKLSDDSLTFAYHGSINRGNQHTLVVEVNDKALQMICKEPKVKQIRPNYNASTVSKKNTEAMSGQDLITSTNMEDHCGLPEMEEEFPIFFFVYHKAANLDKIITSVKRYYRNSAKVQLAVAIEQPHMIIFQMNRAAYLQACRNPEITLVEHAKVVNSSPPETS